MYDLGIIGGLGPFASTAFLQTIYDVNIKGVNKEQELPNVITLSVPMIPDRTEAMEALDDKVRIALSEQLRTMCIFPVKKIVICCVTSHLLLPYTIEHFSYKLLSLIDVMEDEINRRETPALLLASKGSYQKGLLSNNENVITPSKNDQELINSLIYEKLKRGVDIEEVYRGVYSLLETYGTDTFIAGCTEFHLLTRYLIQNRYNLIRFIDPLMTIANNLMKE